MRISRKRHQANKYKAEQAKRYHINQHIRAEQVRLIDENGDNVGVVDTSQALAMAQEKDLDLVEVFPLAKPPVAKILDYSKMKYQEEKIKRKGKAQQKKVEIKGIRLSLRIGQHDKDFRIKQAEKFLEDGDKVRIEMILKGREKGHVDLARKNIQQFVDSLNQIKEVKVEQPLSVQGGKLSIIVC
ncbi:MAG: translation initiation factor IF-3 [Candidatus Buchananbacteria bacterium]|nr:translation initiation factor IF-3 [Candidatus Buchananbacteria bacterium]